MTYVFIAVAAITFFEVFARSNTITDMRDLNNAVVQAFSIIRNPAFSDLEKEKASRQGAIAVVRLLGLALIKIAAAIILSTLVLWVLCQIANVPFEHIASMSVSLIVVAGLIPLMLVYGGLRHVLRH